MVNFQKVQHQKVQHQKVQHQIVQHQKIGNCNSDFLSFRHCQVWNFEILNLFEQNQNFAVIFQKYHKRNQKSTKYFPTSWKPSVIPMKFHEILLVSWNLVNYCKISQFLIEFSKSLKDLRKILLKGLGKTVKYWLNIVNFRSSLNVGQLAIKSTRPDWSCDQGPML